MKGGADGMRAFSRRLFPAGFLLLASSSCWWGADPGSSVPRPVPIEQVHERPKLLYCTQYRPPALNGSYTNTVEVEFDVTASGSVINAKVMEEGKAVSASGSLGEVLTLARSCVFIPGRQWGTPVPVHMSMWFAW